MVDAASPSGYTCTRCGHVYETADLEDDGSGRVICRWCAVEKPLSASPSGDTPNRPQETR